MQSIAKNGSRHTKFIHDIHQLLERDESTIKYKYSAEIGKFGYNHVPHRRWLFDRNREKIKNLLIIIHLLNYLLIIRMNIFIIITVYH